MEGFILLVLITGIIGGWMLCLAFVLLGWKYVKSKLYKKLNLDTIDNDGPDAK